MGTQGNKSYGCERPQCPKCKIHHTGPCGKCHNCGKPGHYARECRNPKNANAGNGNNSRGNNTNPRGNNTTPRVNACFECGAQGHFKNNCPKLKVKNEGTGGAQARVYAMGNAGNNPDSNVVTGTFLLNQRYASVLFDTGADRSFISTAFNCLIDATPSPLDNGYRVELADGKVVEVDTIVRGCTLNLLNHPFNFDLMPVELGSFDVIIGMDWLARCHAVIVCDKKLVRVPWGNETLVIRGEGSEGSTMSRLNIISCTKTQEYLSKGCHVFLASITKTDEEDKSEKK